MRGGNRTGRLAVLTASLLLGYTSAALAQAEAGPLSCFGMLQNAGQPDESTATLLCQGARSPEPARCFLRVTEEDDLSTSQALQLCQYATPEEDPAGCYLQAREETFLEEWRAVQLCKPAPDRSCPPFL